ncbi:MAG: hypothetical protein U9Q22_07150 [Candidatus Altiarchaeota archaeon]|nr:hypothetical protein [Candidatus Altiarchaeota archaeon]
MRTKKTVRRRTPTKKKTTMRRRNPKTTYLKDTAADKCFWVSNGWIIRNMLELSTALKNMSDDTFNYHVNKERNDFGKWVKEVIGDKTLAATLGRVKSRNGAVRAVNKRIKQLKG